jgi:hypothetical protein
MRPLAPAQVHCVVSGSRSLLLLLSLLVQGRAPDSQRPRLLARMEKAGVITRRTAGDDRRGLEIALTDAGHAALLAAIDSHLQLVASLFAARLTATDRAALSKALPKLLDKPRPEYQTFQEN